MLPGTSDGNHRPQRHTEPAKYTCTYETLSNKRNTHINWQEVLPTDTHGYSRLQHQCRRLCMPEIKMHEHRKQDFVTIPIAA